MRPRRFCWSEAPRLPLQPSPPGKKGQRRRIAPEVMCPLHEDAVLCNLSRMHSAVSRRAGRLLECAAHARHPGPPNTTCLTGTWQAPGCSIADARASINPSIRHRLRDSRPDIRYRQNPVSNIRYRGTLSCASLYPSIFLGACPSSPRVIVTVPQSLLPSARPRSEPAPGSAGQCACQLL